MRQPIQSARRTACDAFIVTCALTLICAVQLIACGGGTSHQASSSGASDRTLSPVEALQADLAPGFERAVAPRPFVFPQDHGPHPTFRTEWWYFVGNLSTKAGRSFGVQLTFFRHATQPEAPVRDSAWGSHEIFFAHFAVSDIDDERFYAVERFARGALGLAGAEAEPFAVWIEDWSVRRTPPSTADDTSTDDGGGLLPAVLEAGNREDQADSPMSLRLELLSSPPPIPIGDQGLSRKSDTPGAASHYYSLPRIQSRGELRVGGRTHQVTGELWLDREWSTSTLTAEQTGWDWFSLHLDDGRNLMFYQLRRDDGSVETASHGILIDPEGNSEHLDLAAVELEVLDFWRNAEGASYPSGWRLQVPGHGLDLTIEPRFKDQELRLTVSYWEGAVAVNGRDAVSGQEIGGVGYVELVGYAP